MGSQEIQVGLIGLGTVGAGVAQILIGQSALLKRRLGAAPVLARAADLEPDRDFGVPIPRDILTADARGILDDPKIQIVVELIGGIQPAKEYILSAVAAGKHVVTANKALLATHGEEIYEAVDRQGVDLGFEASVGGGIPIIRAMREGLSSNSIESIFGIINGTSNYILTQMDERGKAFEEVLAEAQARGYAEADPTLDVEGLDSAHKLAILVTLAFGTPVEFKSIYTEGITRVTPLDIGYAREFGYRIKLLGIAKRAGEEIEARVHPTMVPEDLPIAQVRDVYNGISVIGDAVGETLFYGRGAGRMPTASAVVGDIVEIGRNILKGACGRVPAASFKRGERIPRRIKPIEEISSLYYLRTMAQDRPGVLSKVSGILGDHGISISSVIQKGRKAGQSVPVVMMTHRALERDVRLALREIDALPIVSGKTLLIRVEDEEPCGEA